MTSPRTTLDREAMQQQIVMLEAERDRMRQTIIGLSSLVALAHAAGFVTAASPLPPPAAHSVGRPLSDLELSQNGNGRPFTTSP